MKRISIFLLSLVSIFIPQNPAMAEQDYLDKRWAKTGCKPLNKQTKNALVPTDWQFRIYQEDVYQIVNQQDLLFKETKLQEFKWSMSTNKANKSAKEKNKVIRPISPLSGINLGTELSADPNNFLTMFYYSGYKGACSQKGYKGMIFTVYLLKERNDKKPFKWLQFQSTGKGRDDSL